MAAGESLPWTIRADDRMVPRCPCGRDLQIGEKVVIFSSDWKIGHKEVIACSVCKPEEVKAAHGS